MKRLILLITFILLSSIAILGQNTVETDVVIMKILEYRSGYTGGIHPVIHITENDGSYRLIDLEFFKKPYLKTNNQNQKTIHRELKIYLSSGYEIISHSISNGDNILFQQEFILIRKQNKEVE